MVLLPKKQEAARLTDYRPISLIHSFGKIISKVLANRLAPRLHDLVSSNQNVFIKKRAIHDSFLLIKNLLTKLYRKKHHSLFIKLDLAKAFDSVSWEYLLEVLHHLGFGQRWRDWVAILLASCSSRVTVNGKPGKPIVHKRGLRQGDPLSPMLFILALEPLHLLLLAAAQINLFKPILNKPADLCRSIYADDVTLFLNPTQQEMHSLCSLLHIFGGASGLMVNWEKTKIFTIACDEEALTTCLQEFPGHVNNFPARYLGLPLRPNALRRADLQPLLDRVEGRLAGWKGTLLSRAGRLTLVASVLSALPTYFLTVFPMPAWAIKRIDKLRRNFLWKG